MQDKDVLSHFLKQNFIKLSITKNELMEIFNLSKSYPTQDIRKQTHLSLIVLSVGMLAVGLSLFFLPKSQPESNMNALRIILGILLTGASLYFLGFRTRYLAYAETGSRICKRHFNCPKEQLSRLREHLADYCSLPETALEKNRLYLVLVHSKDQQYAAFQVLSYASFLYEPVTELCCLKGKDASTFLQKLHAAHGLFD